MIYYSRQCAVSFGEAEQFETTSDEVDRYFRSKIVLHEEAKSFLKSLEQLIGLEKNIKKRNKYIEVRRRLFNRRHIEAANYIKKHKIAASSSKEYIRVCSDAAKCEELLGELYGNCLEETNLFDYVFDNIEFLTALLVGNVDFYERLVKYSKGKSNTKKRRKFVKALHRYLMRSIYKPTPFGLHTYISLHNEARVDEGIVVDLHLSLKSILKLEMKELFETDRYRLNNSILLLENEFYWLVEKNYNYFVKKSTAVDELKRIYDIFLEKDYFTFAEFNMFFGLKQLSRTQSLFKILKDSCFIVLGDSFSPIDVSWEDKLEKRLKDVNSKEYNEICKEYLKLLSLKKKIENSAIDKVKDIFQELLLTRNTLCSYVSEDVSLKVGKVCPVYVLAKKHIDNKNPMLSDVEAMKLLRGFTSFVDLSYLDNRAMTVLKDKLYSIKDKGKINLLELFYKHYKELEVGFRDNHSVSKKMKLRLNEVMGKLLKHSRLRNGYVDLSWGNVDEVFKKEIRCASVSYQYEESMENPIWYVNKISHGNAKMFGRYLTKYENINIEDYRCVQRRRGKYVEIKRNIYSNNAIIPCTADVGMDTSEFADCENNLKLSDLYILWDEENVELYDAKMNRYDGVIDTCLLALEVERNNPFTVLMAFMKLPYFYTDVVLDKVADENSITVDTVIIKPEIRLSERIVLRRKRYEMNVVEFHKIFESKRSFYLELLDLFASNKIPTSVFYFKTHYLGTGKNGKKPMFLNLYDPVSVASFYSDIKDIENGNIIWEEFHPSYKTCSVEDKYATEYFEEFDYYA